MEWERWHGAGMLKPKFSFHVPVWRTRRTCETILKPFILWMQMQWHYTGCLRLLVGLLHLIQLKNKTKKKTEKGFFLFFFFKLIMNFPILPFYHSSSQGSAWQDQFLARRPQRAWSSTCTLGMFCDCTARHCWTLARCHPHTARDPGTDLQPGKLMKKHGLLSSEAPSNNQSS